MKPPTLLLLLLLPMLLVSYVPVTAAQDFKLSADCNPWSSNYWGDVRITSQTEADQLACFSRIMGSVTLVQSDSKPIVLPHLRGIIGDLRIVLAMAPSDADQPPRRMLKLVFPKIEEVRGHISLEYRASSLARALAELRE